MTQPTPSSVDAMREAKPCQKCGGKGFPRQSGDGDVEWLQCCSCGHEGPLRYSLTEAVAAWNATLPSDGVTIPADHIADAGKMVAARLRDEIGREAKNWQHNAYTRVMLAQWYDRLAAAPKAPPVAQAEGVWRERWYGSEPEKGSAITDERGNLVAYFGGDETTHAAVTKIVALHNAALSATTEQGEGDRFANDAAAKALYDTWSHMPGWVPWVERGNSDMQERARREVML